MDWKCAALVYINGRKFFDQLIYCAPLERESVRLRWLVRFRRNLELDTELNIVSGLDLFARDSGSIFDRGMVISTEVVAFLNHCRHFPRYTSD